ncbi:unnamed protein product [Brassica napus]|uniref:(rape) hypothetical protein n=1 Tax=Brassica napus TaxID=3708 RepID=A0A816MF85_BRANA|nr:unnamed protein product [Brassica napus]
MGFRDNGPLSHLKIACNCSHAFIWDQNYNIRQHNEDVSKKHSEDVPPFFAFLFNSCTANKVADSLIQKSCKKITKFLDKDSDSNFEKDCVASLRENPESQKFAADITHSH